MRVSFLLRRCNRYVFNRFPQPALRISAIGPTILRKTSRRRTAFGHPPVGESALFLVYPEKQW